MFSGLRALRILGTEPTRNPVFGLNRLLVVTDDRDNSHLRAEFGLFRLLLRNVIVHCPRPLRLRQRAISHYVVNDARASLESGY